MRLVMVMVLALVASPLSVSAQPVEEDSLSSWQVDEGASLEQPAPEEPAPASEPAPEEPALQLKLDDAGVEVAPPDDVAERSSFSAELRFRLFTTAYRWSSYSSDVVDQPESGKRSLHVVPAVGVRF